MEGGPVPARTPAPTDGSFPCVMGVKLLEDVTRV